AATASPFPYTTLFRSDLRRRSGAEWTLQRGPRTGVEPCHGYEGVNQARRAGGHVPRRFVIHDPRFVLRPPRRVSRNGSAPFLDRESQITNHESQMSRRHLERERHVL